MWNDAHDNQSSRSGIVEYAGMASQRPSSSRNVPSQSTLNPNMDADNIINSGPIDDSYLTRQSSHRTQEIWNNSKDPKVYAPLRVKHVTLEVPDDRIMQYVDNAGFYPWSIVCNVKTDPGLVTELVERWRSRHTFHFN